MTLISFLSVASVMFVMFTVNFFVVMFTGLCVDTVNYIFGVMFTGGSQVDNVNCFVIMFTGGLQLHAANQLPGHQVPVLLSGE